VYGIHLGGGWQGAGGDKTNRQFRCRWTRGKCRQTRQCLKSELRLPGVPTRRLHQRFI
jgi:hypothetical protein